MLPHLAFPEVNLLQYDVLSRSKTWATLQFGEQLDGWRELKTSFSKNGTVTVSNGESALSFQVQCSSLEANATHVLLKGTFDTWFDFKTLERGIKITVLGTAAITASYQFSFKSEFQLVNYTLWSGTVGFCFDDAKNLDWAITKNSLGFVVLGKFAIDPSLVDNSTSLVPVGTPQQRGQVYASGYHYFFYTNGTNFGFRSSSDGISWSSFVNLPTLGQTNYANRFDIAYFNTTNKIAYVNTNQTSSGTGTEYRIFFRQGSPDGSGGITWDATEQSVHKPAAPSMQIVYPSISYDAAGYPWISYSQREGTLSRVYVRGTLMTNGSWIERIGSPFNPKVSNYLSIPNSVTVGLNANETYTMYYPPLTADIRGRMWNGSLVAEETIAADIFGQNVWSVSRQGVDIGLAFQSSNASAWFYFQFRNYTTSAWISRETVYYPVAFNIAPILAANDTCWFMAWCSETIRQIHYKVRNSSALWDPTGTQSPNYYSITDTYGGGSWNFGDGLALQLSFYAYGNILCFGYYLTNALVWTVRYAFLDFNVIAGAWHDLATWTTTLQTRQWIDVSTWTETLIARQWNTITTWTYNEVTRQWVETATWIETTVTRQWTDIATWTQTFQTRLWREMATWQQDPITRMWHETTWLADLITLGWHEIALWTITLGKPDVPYIIPILFLGCLVGAILIVAFMKKKG